MYVLKPFFHIVALLGALLLVTACPSKPEPYIPPEPEKEDPVLAVTVPGAYGVAGGHQVYNPASLQEGRQLALNYRVMVNGYTLHSRTYEQVEVLKVTSQMIWLKKDEDTYFVLKR